ncbi:MAG: molybdopterin adenylyltransferase [Balneolaceae bacterium]|nr:molybdopterin adenylyltransferase [Balneolaceae bacterium]
MDTVTIGIITLSDRASRGEYEDRSGPEIKKYFSERIKNPIEWRYEVIPDERDKLRKILIELSDLETGLICTTGGTGPAPRDITPQVTENFCEKILPGFGEEMRRVSLQFVPTAILSAQTAGIRKKSLIINLPGKPKAIAECLDAVYPAIPYCLDLIGAPRMEFTEKGNNAFRPPGK